MEGLEAEEGCSWRRTLTHLWILFFHRAGGTAVCIFHCIFVSVFRTLSFYVVDEFMKHGYPLLLLTSFDSTKLDNINIGVFHGGDFMRLGFCQGGNVAFLQQLADK